MGHAFVCFRYCLVAGAILLGISGAIVSVFASYFIYQLHEYAPLTPNHVCGSSATLLAMGVITCGIGWFAWQFLDFSNKGQVVTFAVVLAIIVLIETGVGIWALVRHEQLDTLSPAQHEEIFALAVTDEKSVWDHMQSTLQCCGIDGPADYRGVEAIPWSCCNTTNQHDNDNNTGGACTTINKRGCQHVVLNRTRSILLHVFLLALCFVLLQISFIACTTCYVRIYKDRMERRASEIAMRTSLQDMKEAASNNLLTRQSKYLHNSGGP